MGGRRGERTYLILGKDWLRANSTRQRMSSLKEPNVTVALKWVLTTTLRVSNEKDTRFAVWDIRTNESTSSNL